MNQGFDRIFSTAAGRPIQYKDKLIERMDVIQIEKECHLRVAFLSVDSNWRQGIRLETKGTFYVNNQVLDKKIVLWQDTAPKEVPIFIKTKNKELIVYNVWDTGNGSIDAWHNGAAFYKKIDEYSRIYYCNDGHPDDNFDDLVFSIKII